MEPWKDIPCRIWPGAKLKPSKANRSALPYGMTGQGGSRGRRSQYTQDVLAKMFNVSAGSIQDIIEGVSYSWLEV